MSQKGGRTRRGEPQQKGVQSKGEIPLTGVDLPNSRVVEGAEQPQRSKSLFKRKKRSQSSQPDEAEQPQAPQRRHTLSGGSQGNEVFSTKDSQGAEVETVADLQLQIEQLKDDVHVAQSHKYKEIETLRAEKDHNIGELQEENAKLTIQIKELLEQQEQQKEKPQMQKEMLDDKYKAQEEIEVQQMEATELELLRKELESKQCEAEKLHKESEAAKNTYTNEMEIIKAEHERVTELRHEAEQKLRKKEGEVELWQRNNKQMREEIAELHEQLEKQTKKFEDDKDTCTLPAGPIIDEIKATKNELEEALVKLEESKEELTMKDKEVDRLARELEFAKAKHTEELQIELERRDARHAEEMGHLKSNFAQKRQQDEELAKQEMQKKVDHLERASRDRRLELKRENETLKKELKQKEHELKTCVDSVKSISAQRHERQLKEKTKEMQSLNEQLNEARSQQQMVVNESKKLEQKLVQQESELAAAQKNYDKLFSAHEILQGDHEQLKSDHEQLGVMIKLRKHEEASAAATTNWIHSSEDCMESEISDDLHVQHGASDSHSEEEEYHSIKSETSLDNLTDTEKADLQRKLSETQEEVLNRDQKIKELNQRVEDLEHQLVHINTEHFQNELGDPVNSASGTKEKVVSYVKFSKLRTSYGEVVERLTKLKERHERVKQELTEKLEQRQIELESGRQLPQTHRSFSSEDHVDVEDMDHKTAVQEVGRLRLIVDEKEKQVLSLTTQVQSFNKTAAERQELEHHTKEQSRAVMDWRRKFETLEAENNRLKESKEELDMKIEEHEVLQKEYDAVKQNIKREQQMVNDQKGTIVQLQHEIQHLKDQLEGYNSMHLEVNHLKENASGMLKRLWSLLGKHEGDRSMGFKELTKKIDELMGEVEAQRLQAQAYKEDFEAEREDRAEAAGRKDEEIAGMQKLYSEAIHDRDTLQGSLTKALKDLDDSKKLLQDTIDGAAKNMEDLRAAHEREMNSHLEDAEKTIERNQNEMKAEVAKLNERISCLEEGQAQLARDRDQLRENRDEVKRERDDLKKQCEAVNDQRKAKEKEAELIATERNELQNEVQHLREQLKSVTESLHMEIREVTQQLAVANADKKELSDESLAKTQQVKQYKKQVDTFRSQLQESAVKIEQYQTRLHRCESDLEYCQRDLKSREEDEESKVEIIQAQNESEISALRSELGTLRREKADLMQQLRQQKGVVFETAHLVDLERETTEWKRKYTQLWERFNGIFQHNDQLVATLEEHNIPVPKLPQMGQKQENAASQSPPKYNLPRDGEPDKSVTSPAVVGPQPLNVKSQHQLVISGNSSMPYQGGMQQQQQQYPRGHTSHGGMMAAPGEQDQYQQQLHGQQVWLGGHQGGRVAPGYHPGHVHGNQQNLMTQHGMGNTNGAIIGMEQQQQLGVVTQESDHQRVPSGPQENPLLQGINTEMHNVAAVVGKEVDNNPELQSFSPQAPFDPNLICPMCRQQFRIGEIQKYRQHVQHCHGT